MIEKFSKILPNDLILDSMPGLTYIFSKEGKLVYWGSKKAWKILEYSAEELNNMHLMEFVDDADKAKVMAAFQDVFTIGYTQVEHLVITKSAKRVPVLANATLIMVDGEEFMIGLTIEISELAAARQKIQEQVKEISRLNELLKAENVYLKDQLDPSSERKEFIGISQPFKYVIFKIQQVAPTDASVLIEGETGTGKDLVAKEIHKGSKRSNKPFIKVNCASIPENLIESELFGHEKGAFTGAVEKRIGRFELANGGTIFLDEIGELPLNLQPKLLNILQQGEFERIGSSKTIKTDVRIIAATNKVLKNEIDKGRFRNDLYYRLNVFPISVAPLRERKADIVPLAENFVKRYSVKFNKQINTISEKSLNLLLDYSWPGNIRELENVIERAVITSESNELNLESLIASDSSSDNFSTLEELEKNHMIQALEKTSWKISGTGGAAAILNINPETLRSRMRKLGIKRNNL